MNSFKVYSLLRLLMQVTKWINISHVSLHAAHSLFMIWTFNAFLSCLWGLESYKLMYQKILSNPVRAEHVEVSICCFTSILIAVKISIFQIYRNRHKKLVKRDLYGVLLSNFQKCNGNKKCIWETKGKLNFRIANFCSF